MWIKICANTSLADALAAAHLGVDAVGFVFAPSTRQVHAEQVRAMVAGLPLELEKVGVFPALDAAEIAAAARVAGLTGIQLHGGWDAGLTAVLTRLVPEMKLIQTAHWDVDEVHAGAYVEAALKEMPADARMLVDAKVGRSSGGTGRTFEWDAAKGIFAGHAGREMILAGGLRPENVGEAVRTLNPWGLDVASGVESEPGRKDLGKLAAFIENARNA